QLCGGAGRQHGQDLGPQHGPSERPGGDGEPGRRRPPDHGGHRPQAHLPRAGPGPSERRHRRLPRLPEKGECKGLTAFPGGTNFCAQPRDRNPLGCGALFFLRGQKPACKKQTAAPAPLWLLRPLDVPQLRSPWYPPFDKIYRRTAHSALRPRTLSAVNFPGCVQAVRTCRPPWTDLNRALSHEGESRMKQYDYLIVGAGLFGAVFAHEARKAGRRCLVIDRRSHIAGNVYTEPVEGINVHRYGAHIFHTNSREVWAYVGQFAEFNRYTNSPIANYHGEIYNLPFNMNTFNRMWGVVTPAQAQAKIEEQRAAAGITEPQNLEEQAISLVGTDIYEK